MAWTTFSVECVGEKYIFIILLINNYMPLIVYLKPVFSNLLKLYSKSIYSHFLYSNATCSFRQGKNGNILSNIFEKLVELENSLILLYLTKKYWVPVIFDYSQC